MEKRHRKLLLAKRLELIKDLEANDVVGYLYQYGVITSNNKEEIENQTTRKDRAEFLLDLLPRKGELAFQKFVDVLKECKVYEYLADLLQDSVDGQLATDSCDGRPRSTYKSLSNIEIRPRSSSKLEPDMLHSYEINSSPKGWCFILNNSEFYTLPDRTGSNVDAINLQTLFQKLGFQIWSVNNATADGIKEKFIQLANKVDHTDSLVVCLLSHGVEGQVYGVDGGLVSISELLHIISKGPVATALADKPKLFVIQACRTNTEKDQSINKNKQIHTSETIATNNKQTKEQKVLKSFIDQSSSQLQKHLLLGYSTFPGEVSWRNTEHGSYYIDSFVEVFQNFASSEDVLSMLVKVNELVGSKLSAHGVNQTPSPVFTTTKKLYLLPV